MEAKKIAVLSGEWLRKYSIHIAVVATFLIIASLVAILLSRAATQTYSLMANEKPTLTSSYADGIELGMKFRVSVEGEIRSIRFYKAPTNTGTHTGSIWDATTGKRLAQTTFNAESASGWQTANLSTPLNIQADRTYIVSYFAPKGHYSSTADYFSVARSNGPLSAIKSTSTTYNGVFMYSPTSAYPGSNSGAARNYWVDVVFAPTDVPPPPPPANSVSLWDNETPQSVDTDTRSVEVGTNFTVAKAGKITSMRFYKAAANTGTHIGSIWNHSTKARLAQVTFTNETASGWQSANLSTPLAVKPGVVYTASYLAPQGNYSYNLNYFANTYSKGPLTALANTSTRPNGMYAYTAESAYPANGSSSSRNYWVDVRFVADAETGGEDDGDNPPPPPPPPASSYNEKVLADRPVAFWAMNKPDATEPDLTGTMSAGTYVGGKPTLAALPNKDQATVFNGSSQYMAIPSHPKMSIPTTKKLTWEAWIRPDTLQFPNSLNGYVDWMGKCYEYAPTCEWEARMYNATNSQGRCSRLSAYAFNLGAKLGSAGDWQPSCNGIKVGQWYHVVAHYQTETTPAADCKSSYPGTIDIWVNGVKWSQSHHGDTGCMSQYSVKPTASTSPLYIGTMSKDSWFKGGIAKVAIYDKPLTQAQINAHFTAMTGVAPAGSCANTCTTTSSY